MRNYKLIQKFKKIIDKTVLGKNINLKYCIRDTSWVNIFPSFI